MSLVLDFVKGVKSGKIDVAEHTAKALEQAKKINAEYRYMTVFEERCLGQAKELAKQLAKGKGERLRLAGVLLSVKDCICVEGLESTAGSAILKGYKPLFDATAVARCKAEGAIILGKTVQDEFGFGGFSTNIGLGYERPLNPFDKARSCGGSSGGAAGLAQKAPFAHLALAESTGGSIVNPAAFCGVTGLCPTYGRVSRHGLIDYANSLDKIGCIGKSVEEVALLLEIISGRDEQDSTSSPKPVRHFEPGKGIKGITLGIVQGAFGEGVDKAVSEAVKNAITELESAGAKLTKVDLPLTMRHGIPTYYILAMSEASTNLAKFCGMRYGSHEPLEGHYHEYFSKVRTKHFGPEAKRRILLGTFARMAGYRDAYYLKAAAVRAKIIQEYKQAFSKADVLITPTMPILPPTFDQIEKLSPLQNYMADILTVGPNLAGLPHISIPCGLVKGLPVGMMIIGDHFEEFEILNAADSYESRK